MAAPDGGDLPTGDGTDRPASRGSATTGSPRHRVRADARHSDARRWVALIVLCVSLLVVSLDNTILNVALPTLVRDLHASDSQLQWIVDSYAVVFAGLLLAFGSLGDRIGRKVVFMAGLVLFAAGSAASAFSGTPTLLVVARGFMGIGGAAIMPTTLSIITNIFTEPHDRARAIGIWSGTTGIGIGIGPIVGGWLLAHFWWGSVFLVNVPIAAAGALAAWWLVPNSKSPTPKRIDPVGAVCSIVGLALVVGGIIEAPQRGWGSPLVWGTLVVGCLVMAGFVWWERRIDHPMLPLEFFSSRRFSVAMSAMALVIFALMGTLFLLTQYLQFSLGYSPLETGVRVMPVAALILVVAPLSTVLVRMVGTKIVVFVGLGLIAAGMVLLSRTTTAGTYGDALVALLLLGLGTGLSFAPSTESIMGSLPADQAGVGSATNGSALQVGGALGVAVLGSLLNMRFHGDLGTTIAGHGIPANVQHLILGSLGGALAVAEHVGGALGAALADAARKAFLAGMDLAMVVGAVAAAAGALLVLVLLPARDGSELAGRAGARDAGAPDAGTGGSAAGGSAAGGSAADESAADGSAAGGGAPRAGSDAPTAGGATPE